MEVSSEFQYDIQQQFHIYAQHQIEQNRCAMACQGCGAVSY